MTFREYGILLAPPSPLTEGPSPLSFCFWGFLKSKFYSPSPATLTEVQANIFGEVAQIDSDMMMRTMLDMKEREVKCIGAGAHTLRRRAVTNCIPV